ncbi:MAG: DEAD/DEAH box helicase family protein, partial [Cyanobacteria bacterium J06649_4]
AIANRLSLRPPQRESLEILHHVYDLISPKQTTDLAAALETIKSEYPTVTSFERDFPSLCFALATGVGKTRLMGAFITYLYRAHGVRNFFVLAPNLTIYEKLIADFTPETAKYVFKGISEFAIDKPEIITGDNYEKASTITDFIRCKINIFNVSKINKKDKKGSTPKIKRLSEYLGDSYFNYLAELDDLVMLMDESHRYRSSAGMKAINELKPILGLELTATPFIEKNKGPQQFKNVAYEYSLARAIADGFVKDPAVATRRDFSASGMSTPEIETLKLEDGMRLHETIKAELTTYARITERPLIKPFVLVIARDTTHAAKLLELIESEDFFKGRYKGKAIQVDSSTRGKEEDKMIGRLLQVESADEPTEIVIHVNMLKEGWDVTNLYTIVPLRAANAKTLVTQSIGRGLRLPYGKRTGETVIDRLNIVAHDKFQEIVDESNRSDSVIRQIEQVFIDPSETATKVSIVSEPNIAALLGQSSAADLPAAAQIPPAQIPQTDQTAVDTGGPSPAAVAPTPAFNTPEEQQIAQLAYKAIQSLESNPRVVPTTAALTSAAVQQLVKDKVDAQYRTDQLTIEGISEKPNIEAVIAKTTELVIQQTIDIPRITVVPTGEVNTGFHPFMLDPEGLSYQPPSEEMWIQSLQTGDRDIIGLGEGNMTVSRLEDYIVGGLIDFDDIAYDNHADLLYDLASQVVEHLSSYLDAEDTQRVLRVYQKNIAQFIHAQMQPHFWEEATGYEAQVSRGFTELKKSAYTATETQLVLDYRYAPDSKRNISSCLFGGFSKCLYRIQKFDSDSERLLAVVLERGAIKWFRPVRGQFQLYYRYKGTQPEYQPDFVAETDDAIYMLEPKMSTQLNTEEVLAKKKAAIEWCAHASAYMQKHGGKPWVYALIPHDAIAENMTLSGLVQQYAI